MDIYWYGQACFKLKGKEASVVIDPFDPDVLGLKLPKDLEGDCVLVTHQHKDHNYTKAVTNQPIAFLSPGEYEVKGAVVTGIDSFHDNSNGSLRGKNTIWHILMDGLNIVHLGDLGQKKLIEDQVAAIGQTDILMVPVGSIFTIDAKDATEIVAQLEPKIIIPMHYGLPGMKFELESVEKFLKEMGEEGITPINKLSITKEKLPEEPEVTILNYG